MRTVTLNTIRSSSEVETVALCQPEVCAGLGGAATALCASCPFARLRPETSNKELSLPTTLPSQLEPPTYHSIDVGSSSGGMSTDLVSVEYSIMSTASRLETTALAGLKKVHPAAPKQMNDSKAVEAPPVVLDIPAKTTEKQSPLTEIPCRRSYLNELFDNRVDVVWASQPTKSTPRPKKPSRPKPLKKLVIKPSPVKRFHAQLAQSGGAAVEPAIKMEAQPNSAEATATSQVKVQLKTTKIEQKMQNAEENVVTPKLSAVSSVDRPLPKELTVRQHIIEEVEVPDLQQFYPEVISKPPVERSQEDIVTNVLAETERMPPIAPSECVRTNKEQLTVPKTSNLPTPPLDTLHSKTEFLLPDRQSTEPERTNTQPPTRLSSNKPDKFPPQELHMSLVSLFIQWIIDIARVD